MVDWDGCGSMWGSDSTGGVFEVAPLTGLTLSSWFDVCSADAFCGLFISCFVAFSSSTIIINLLAACVLDYNDIIPFWVTYIVLISPNTHQGVLFSPISVQ